MPLASGVTGKYLGCYRSVPCQEARTWAVKDQNMRKHISFTVAAMIFGLGMMLWAQSAVVATQAHVVRRPIGTSAYVVLSNSYLPIQVLEETY